jgi:uncharacterized protein (AIM24 family)
VRSELFGSNLEASTPGEPFALQNSRMLRVALDGDVMARQGSMIAFQGQVDFEYQGSGGIGRMLKKAVTGEGVPLMRCRGKGDVFFANYAAEVHLTVLQGSGWVAVTAHGTPVVLQTDAPTYVDAQAAIAWSADLQTSIHRTMKAGALVGRGSGEAVQLAFAGSGSVIVQASEGEGWPRTSTAAAAAGSTSADDPPLGYTRTWVRFIAGRRLAWRSRSLECRTSRRGVRSRSASRGRESGASGG